MYRLALATLVASTACQLDEDMVTSAPAALNSSGTLRDTAGPSFLTVGAAVARTPFNGDQTYRTLLSAQYNEITPENVLKWEQVHPERARFDWASGDAMVAFAEANWQTVRGHTLVWHKQLPPYIASATGAANVRTLLREHIDGVVGHFKTRIEHWDVVNEAIDDRGVLRDTPFSRALGSGWVAEAYRMAAAADPTARLAYNDYGIEVPGVKQDKVYELLAGLKQAGVPLHEVGLQLHVKTYEFTVGRMSTSIIRDAIRRFATLGVDVYITELDLPIDNLSGPEAQRLDLQKRAYHQVAAACYAESACKGVTTWGFTDAFTWLPAGRPLPFDANYVAKPAFNGLRDGIAGTPAPSIGIQWDTACGTSLTTAQFCEPFESDTLSPFGLIVEPAATSFARSNTFRFRGGFALQARTPTATVSRRAYASRRVWSGVTSGQLWMRSYVYLPSTSASNFTFFSIDEDGAPYQGVGFGVNSSGRAQLKLTTAGLYPASTLSFPRDRWTCAEMRVDVGSSGGATLYLDGTMVASVANVDTLPALGFGMAKMGVVYAPPNGAEVAVHFDEVALSRTRLGCNP